METALLLPNGGWDVHHHIYEPTEFAYAQRRHLTPVAATIPQFLHFKSSIGASHSVLVQGLCYGSDCSSLLAFLQRLDSKTTKGIAVIDPYITTDAEINAMQSAGVRGVRVNLYDANAMHNLEKQKQLLRHYSARLQAVPGWTMAFTQLHPEFWPDLKPVVEKDVAGNGIRLITDHFALLKGQSMLPSGTAVDEQPGFEAIMSLVREGLLWVKLSAPYRSSCLAPQYDDLKPIVRALADANPRRILWGSDWPHTPQMKVRSLEEAMITTPNLDIDDSAWLQSLRKWLSDEEWELMLRINPAALYDW